MGAVVVDVVVPFIEVTAVFREGCSLSSSEIAGMWLLFQNFVGTGGGLGDLGAFPNNFLGVRGPWGLSELFLISALFVLNKSK